MLQSLWKPKAGQKSVKRPPKRWSKYADEEEENEFQFGPFSLEITGDLDTPRPTE